MFKKFLISLLILSVTVPLLILPSNATASESGTTLTNMWHDLQFKTEDILKSIGGKGVFSIETDAEGKNWGVEEPGTEAKVQLDFIFQGFTSYSGRVFQIFML